LTLVFHSVLQFNGSPLNQSSASFSPNFCQLCNYLTPESISEIQEKMGVRDHIFPLLTQVYYIVKKPQIF